MAGNTLYQTTDGGRRWQAVRPVAATATLYTAPGGVFMLLSIRPLRARQLDLTLGRWSRGASWPFRTSEVSSFVAAADGCFAPPDVHWAFVSAAAGRCLMDMGGGMHLNDAQLWETTTGGRTWTALTRAPTPAGTIPYGYKGGIG